MKICSIANNICYLISIICLGVGYILEGYWMVLFALLIMTLFWIIMRKKSAFWPASTLLFVYIVLAANGAIIKLSMPLLVVGCTTALASWDLAHFNQSMAGNTPLLAKRSMEKYHLQSLAATLGAGSLLTVMSSFIRLQFSFGASVFLVLMVVGCFTFGLKYILRQNR